MKHLQLLLIPLFILCTSFHSGVMPASESETSVKLARQVSKLLGVTVNPANVKVLPVRKIQRWIGVPSFIIDKLETGEYSHFIFAEFTFNEKVKEVVLGIPESLREKFGADFIIAVNQNTGDGEEPTLTRCEARRCDESGNCRTETFLIEGGDCIDACSTSEQCQQPCFVGICSNGICMPSVVYANDCGSVEGTCLSALDCPESGTDSSCELKMCMMDGHCWPVTFQIDSETEECPSDECNVDEECIGFGEGVGGVLDNIKEIYGY